MRSVGVEPTIFSFAGKRRFQLDHERALTDVLVYMYSEYLNLLVLREITATFAAVTVCFAAVGTVGGRACTHCTLTMVIDLLKSFGENFRVFYLRRYVPHSHRFRIFDVYNTEQYLRL
jgi:hypothetical protein